MPSCCWPHHSSSMQLIYLIIHAHAVGYYNVPAAYYNDLIFNLFIFSSGEKRSWIFWNIERLFYLFMFISTSNQQCTLSDRLDTKLIYFYFQSKRHNLVGFCIATNTLLFIYFHCVHVFVRLSCVLTRTFLNLFIYLFIRNAFVSGYATMNPFWVN